MPVLLGDAVVNGGCGGQMDFKTSYIFFENFGTITPFKEPQDVRFGALIASGKLSKPNLILKTTKTDFVRVQPPQKSRKNRAKR